MIAEALVSLHLSVDVDIKLRADVTDTLGWESEYQYGRCCLSAGEPTIWCWIVACAQTTQMPFLQWRA